MYHLLFLLLLVTHPLSIVADDKIGHTTLNNDIVAEHHHLGVHEHGRGSLNFAIEGDRISIELISSAADILGFEHKAQTRIQTLAVDNAKMKLKDISNIILLPSAASCKVDQSAVNLIYDHNALHSEFLAIYDITCEVPEKLVKIDISYFEIFEDAKKLTVNVVGSKLQKKIEANRGLTEIDLEGIS